MKSGYLAVCAAGLFMLLSGCSDTPAVPADTSAADQKAIRDSEAAWVGEYASKDLDKAVSHYADDATLMAPNMPAMKGKEAIRAGLKEMLSDPNVALNFAPTSVVTSKGGDIAYSEGTYSMTMTNPKTKKPETEKGEYVTVYKKQADNTWKAVEDISTPNAPAASATVAKVKKSAPAPARKNKRKK